MPNSNYALSSGGTWRSGANRATQLVIPDNSVPTTTAVQIVSFEANSGLVDNQYAMATFISN